MFLPPFVKNGDCNTLNTAAELQRMATRDLPQNYTPSTQVFTVNDILVTLFCEKYLNLDEVEVLYPWVPSCTLVEMRQPAISGDIN